MRELILHHRYSLGTAWDTTDYGNHGVVAPSIIDDQGSLRFTDPSSRIDVQASSSLRDLGAFRCSITFQLEGNDPDARYNLVESQLSFALYIDPAFTIRTTILDGNGDWNGAHTGTLPLNDGHWHRADCGHDGLSTSWVALDGEVLAVRNDVPGPVRRVGTNGLTIGHWPEPVDNYAFDGRISEVWLWRDRPESPIDACCTDPEAVARAGDALRRLGYDRERLADLQAELQQVVAGLYTQLPEHLRANVRSTATRVNNAFRAGRYAQFAQHAHHLNSLLTAALRERTIEEALGRVIELLTEMGDDADIRAALPGLLCGEVKDRSHTPRRSRGDRDRPSVRDPYTGDPTTMDYPGYPPAGKPANPGEPRMSGQEKPR